MGVLTDFLMQEVHGIFIWLILIRNPFAYLHQKVPFPRRVKSLMADYLKEDFKINHARALMQSQETFPTIFLPRFSLRSWRKEIMVTEVVCMLQKEVAQRIASPKGNKDYGILVRLACRHSMTLSISLPFLQVCSIPLQR
jgi:16S rRNA (adenine1518-N6/adenine1519-N6)-dimethyltransferase